MYIRQSVTEARSTSLSIFMTQEEPCQEIRKLQTDFQFLTKALLNYLKNYNYLIFIRNFKRRK